MNCLLTRLVLWLVTLAVFPLPSDLLPLSFRVEVLQHLSLTALPQERPLELTARIATRLVEAEAKENHPHFQDDYRIARVTVGLAAKGECVLRTPHVEATYNVLGLHPDKVWPAIIARRKAQFGTYYEKFYDENGNQKPDPEMLQWMNPPSSPKKPVQSVKSLAAARKRRAA